MEQTKTYRKYKENLKFKQMAKDAKTCYKLGQAVLVNLELDISDVKLLAVAAGASYRLTRIELIHGAGDAADFFAHVAAERSGGGAFQILEEPLLFCVLNG